MGHDSGARLPEEWRERSATIISKSRRPELVANRPVMPPVPLFGFALRLMIIDHSSRLQPRHLLAEGFVDGRGAQSLILAAKLLASPSGGSPLGF